MDNIRKDLLAGRFQRNEDGSIFLPDSRLLLSGEFRYNKRGEPEECSTNLVVNEGLDYILNAAINNSGVNSSWYIVPFLGTGTPAPGWTAANFHANATEWIAYDEPNRGDWQGRSAVASATTDNFAAKEPYTSSGMGEVVNGAGLISTQGKMGLGTLLAASKFPSTKTLDTGEILDIGYGLTLTAVP